MIGPMVVEKKALAIDALKLKTKGAKQSFGWSIFQRNPCHDPMKGELGKHDVNPFFESLRSITLVMISAGKLVADFTAAIDTKFDSVKAYSSDNLIWILL